MSRSQRAAPRQARRTTWKLRLYVAGQTPKSMTAIQNLKRLCDEHLDGRFQLEVIDLARAPHRAQADDIVAIPTLVRRLPPPLRKIIGDLSDAQRVLVSLDVEPLSV